MSGMCVEEIDCVSSYACLYYIQSHVDYDHLVWIVHLFIAKHEEFTTLSWWRWEYTVQVPPLGRDVPDAVHYVGKRAGSPDLGHIWNFAGIWSKTPPLTTHKDKSLLSFPPGRPQDFRLEISRYAMHQCWTFWLARRSSQTLHSDSSSELKQIRRPCWETRLKSELVEHLCSCNTGTVKRSACTFTLHTVFTLHRIIQLMRTRGQPHGWLVQPQMELDWPLGSLCSHLWSCKITNAFCKKASANQGEQNSKQLEGMR